LSSIAYELGRCVVCGSAEADEIADDEQMRAEVEALWAFQTRRLRPDTPPTRLTDRVAFSQHPPIRLVRCRSCGLVYRNPREREFELRAIYSRDEPSQATMRTLFETQRRSFRVQAKRLKQLLGRAGSGLEVGSYVGAFLRAALDEGWHFEGLDIGEEASAFARQKGFTVTVGSLESWGETTKRQFDAVAIWNTFDQLPDPRVAAAAVHRLVSPGGLFAVRVPNGAFYARVRKLLQGPLAGLARALLAHNNLLTFPYRHGFTIQSLDTLMTKTGFEVEAIHGDSLVLTADRFTRPWAAAEERLIKRTMRIVGAMGDAGAERAPWLEVYARRR
jgi:SAM-dependent methyltransferase